MAAKAKAAKAGAAAYAAKDNAYVQRLVEDDDLRENIRVAFESARDAYGRLTNGKGPAHALMDDKKLHKDLKKSAEAFRDASGALRQKRKRRRGLGVGRLLLVSIVGGAVALAASEDLRNKVLDALFGAEEEFDYTSTTSPPSTQSASEPVTPGSTS